MAAGQRRNTNGGASPISGAVEARRGSGKRGAGTANGRNGSAPDARALHELLHGLCSARDGDFTVRLPSHEDEPLSEIAQAYNDLVENNQRMTDELSRVGKVIGREGKTTERAELPRAEGSWRSSLMAVNSLIDDLVRPTTEVARVIGAVAEGDLSQKMALTIEGQPVEGEFLRIGTTVNTMVDQLGSFAREVTRVAREVGTEGKLGGQAEVEGVSGTWKDLTDSVNLMAGNLTDQVRNIVQVTTAVAEGDLSQQITVDAQGEVLELKKTINTMVHQLGSFADEVTRVAREVGTEGKLGGQAEVAGVSGTWRGLTENVNQLAGNLTTQVRAIAEVSTAVTQGDFTRSIAVEAQGEVAELKDIINEMISNLRDTTQTNAEEDWLKTNLARVYGLMQGQRDLQAVSRLIMSELTPVVSAQHGAFFLAESVSLESGSGSDGALVGSGSGSSGHALDDSDLVLKLIASYGYQSRKSLSNRFRIGEGLVGQAALERKPILITEAPVDYIKISSGLGEASPVNLVVLPIIFEGELLAVIELASFKPFSETHQTFLEQLTETIGVTLNTIMATMRTETLLTQSQSLTQELQSQSEELQTQQDKLKRSNSELEAQTHSLKASEELLKTQQEDLHQTNDELQEKAKQLGEQNRDIETKNEEIELASRGLEEKAEQLALSSKYKSEFLANMSHELRTPLNSLLILSKLLADNAEQNLTEKQVEFAGTIHTSGSDLLTLINDILDLSKVEAGKMDVSIAPVTLSDVGGRIERTFREVAEQKGLAFAVELDERVGPTIETDAQRLEQVLRNLLSNAVKFTESGKVVLRVGRPAADQRFATETLSQAEQVVAFTVDDTGVGIAADKLNLVFEAFQQADGTTNRSFGGTGLGLSISREISHLLGGEIAATSTLGEGSSFTLFLPASHEASQDRAEPIALGSNVSAAPESGVEGALRAAVPTVAHAPAMSPSTASTPPPEVPIPPGPAELPDDRDLIVPGDRVSLVVEDDAAFAKLVAAVSRERGYKALVALGGDSGLALAHSYKPDVIFLDLSLPTSSGFAVLDHLKRHSDVRHIPVYVVSAVGERHALASVGAAGYLRKPATRHALLEQVDDATRLIECAAKPVLVVAADEAKRMSVTELIGGDDVVVTGVTSSEDALKQLEDTRFGCMVLDLGLRDGFDLLDTLKRDERFSAMPVVVSSNKLLTHSEEARLKGYAETLVVRAAGSPERVLDETMLVLHRPEASLPEGKRAMLEHLHTSDELFQGKRILVVDDDMRYVFALTNALESRGMDVLYAENGHGALEVLRREPNVDLVLMDVMMPGTDGYQAMRMVRGMPGFENLPIISVTAKSAEGDREKSIAWGASDYIAKPVDVGRLLSLMGVWLYRSAVMG